MTLWTLQTSNIFVEKENSQDSDRCLGLETIHFIVIGTRYELVRYSTLAMESHPVTRCICKSLAFAWLRESNDRRPAVPLLAAPTPIAVRHRLSRPTKKEDCPDYGCGIQPPSGKRRLPHLFLPFSMRHFRRKSSSSVTPTTGPPPTPTSPISEFIRRELATIHPQVKDPRTLVASSSAVALSICSPSCEPLGNEPGSSKESGWRTAYGAARMAVEIAKETSDMFLPLKAVVGALSVLIKNYDVSPLQAAHSVGC